MQITNEMKSVSLVNNKKIGKQIEKLFNLCEVEKIPSYIKR